jgi:hypothetical protein
LKWQLPYQGRTYEFDDARLTAAEARLQKRLCGGATPTQASASRFELDPDALVAALVIARKREGLPLDEALSVDDEALDLAAVGEATEAAMKAAVPTPAQDAAAEEIARAKRPQKAADAA